MVLRRSLHRGWWAAVLSLGLIACHAPGAPASGQSGEAALQAGQVQRVGSAALCQAQLFQGQPPQLPSAQVAGAVLLCRPSMAVLASPLSRTGLWSAEYLTPERIEQARTLQRDNTFHPDPDLPASARAELRDYVHTGYDRGHMSPSADQPTAATQNDSFSLANMAPQAPRLNRGPWEHLEVAVRHYALRSPVYVITGVRFVGNEVNALHGRVLVPTTYYKLIYDPARQLGAVYEAQNTNAGKPQGMSVGAFEQLSGIRFNLGNPGLLTLRF